MRVLRGSLHLILQRADLVAFFTETSRARQEKKTCLRPPRFKEFIQSKLAVLIKKTPDRRSLILKDAR